ncbi:zinc-ribbon domain-containing protein [Lutibacter citreus]|uniref:zinc-ribbon domain-containing protein n=1 Tax=Lutibacter citreus TaxID=2138210 RepID=UPI000DBE7665|nr:zinc ribbon domain-containing protein [Lutibacter citreus]
MESNNCPNCGTKIQGKTKFCTNCGASLKSSNNQNNAKKNAEVNLVEESLNQPNKGKRLSIAFLGIVVLTVLFFIGKSFLKDVDSSEKPFSPIEQLTKLEGKWYDPAGIILEEKEAVIILTRKDNIVVGKDENGLFEAKITPFGSNNYQAIVHLRGVKGDFALHFYEEENKLVFFSTLTKSSWNIKKLKK